MDIKAALTEILTENFGVNMEDYSNLEEATLKDLNLDSLDFAQMIFDIESKFNFKFTKNQEADLPNMTLSQLLTFLDSACTS